MANQGKLRTTPIWMPVHIATQVADTNRQSAAEHGAYMRLIYDYWRNGPPPNNDNTLARLAGMTMKEWLAARPAIEPFFVIGDQWIHPATDAELERAYLLIKKNAARTQNATYARQLKREANKRRNEQRYVDAQEDVTLSQITNSAPPCQGVRIALAHGGPDEGMLHGDEDAF